MKRYRYRGAFLCAGAIACTLGVCFSAADTNLTPTVRSRDDKNAVVNLAIQVAQQLQSQQQNTEATTRQTAESVASLRRLILLIGVSLALGIVALLLYARRLVRLLQQRAPVISANHEAHSSEALARRGAALEHLHRLEEALACYEQAIAMDPALTDAYVGKGRVLNQLERYREALDCFERASQLQPRPGAHRSTHMAA